MQELHIQLALGFRVHSNLPLQVYMVGPKFTGVKMIPPGVHFFSYQYLPSSGHSPPAVSMFRHLSPKQVVVQRWDPALEGLAPLADEGEVRAKLTS